KGVVQLGFGRAPGGFAAYRALTRGYMGTAASHVDKLARVWPGYVNVWRRCGLELEGLAMWTHDAGATPFMPLAADLLTGRGAAVTNGHEEFLDRYLARARAGVLDAAWPIALRDDRKRMIEGMRWVSSCREAVDSVGTVIHKDIASLADSSIGLCHSG